MIARAVRVLAASGPHRRPGRPPARDHAHAGTLLAVFAGGAAGAVARSELSAHWAHPPAAWPWATFVANLAGVLVLGYVFTRLEHEEAVRSHLGALLGPGLCGGLTTFSTLQLELVHMLEAGAVGRAAAYAAATLAAGLAGVAIADRWARTHARRGLPSA